MAMRTGRRCCVSTTALLLVWIFTITTYSLRETHVSAHERPFRQYPYASRKTPTFRKIHLALVDTRGGAAKTTKPPPSTHSSSTISSSVFNLVNNVAGAGILTLSAGMAGGTGYVPAIVVCSLLAVISAHTFEMIGEACELLDQEDFKGLWSETIGSKTTYVVDSMVAVLCLAVCVIYSGILGDVFTPLLDRVGVPTAYNTRTTNIIALTVGLLWPMSLIKDLSKLAFTSILGFAAIMYTVVFIVVRALDGSYRIPGGKFVTDGLIVTPDFAKSSMWNLDFTSLVLASNLGLAYIAHYNAPSFKKALSNSTTQRFASMVRISFVILVALYVMTMIAGYTTFGGVCQGNLLLNYHPNDVLSTLGRLATGFSILFGFPLVAFGAREGLVNACSSLGWSSLGDDRNHLLIVSCILLFVTGISTTVQDVSLVVGLTGAALGSFIVYICPAMLYTKAVQLSKGVESSAYKCARCNLALVPFGLAIGGLGVSMTLKGAATK